MNSRLLLLTTVLGCSSSAPSKATLPSNQSTPTGAQTSMHVVAKTTTLSEAAQLRWPSVEDPQSTIDDVINRGLDFEAVTGEKLADVQKAWAESATPNGITDADFTVTAQQRGVLSLAIHYEYLGAYSTTNYAYLNFDLATGATLQITDLLDKAKLPAIVARLEPVLQARIAKTKQEHAAEIQSGEIPADQWDGLHVTVESLSSFTTTPEGITFHWDAGFPHVMQALAPDGELALGYADLVSAINPRGPWATAH